MKNFTYNISTKVFFGTDALGNLGMETAKYSKRILIVYGSERIKSDGLFDRVVKELETKGISYEEIGGVKPNPSIESVRRGVKIIQEKELDFVLAVGGGSALDAAKAMAVSAAMKIDAWEVWGRVRSVEKALPVASVLTLAATGSEMNGNSVISNEETGEKNGAGSDLMKPVFSILDPTLTYSVPKNQTAAGVVDIFSHVTEQYFDPIDSCAVADRLAEGLMKVCIQYGRLAIDEPENYDARANLMWAGSLALNEILKYGKAWGDWATHQIEHEISAAYDVTHGVGLAVVTPQWMKYVLNEETVGRFAMFAENVWGISKEDKMEQAKAGIEALTAFFKSLDIPIRLSELNIGDEKLDYMSVQATRYGEIGQFRKLNTEDVRKILEGCR